MDLRLKAADTGFYVVLSLMLLLATMVFVDPDRGKYKKWLYWAITPFLIIVFLSLAFKSVVGGIGFGIPAYTLLAVGYLRYRT